jgi:hypothetical protein
VLLLLAATVVVASTDEAYSSWQMRMSRLALFGVPASAIAIWFTQAGLVRGGEQRALLSHGVSPLGSAKGAIVAAWVVGALATLVLLSPWADLSSLFPRVTAGTPWVAVGQGLLDPEQGILVTRDGSIQAFTASRRGVEGQFSERAAALYAALPLYAMVPLWVAEARPSLSALAAVVCSAAALLVSLHMVAARAWPPWSLVAAAVPFLVTLLVRPPLQWLRTRVPH